MGRKRERVRKEKVGGKEQKKRFMEDPVRTYQQKNGHPSERENWVKMWQTLLRELIPQSNSRRNKWTQTARRIAHRKL